MLIDAHSHMESYGDLLDSALEEIDRYRILTLSNSIDVPSYKRNLEAAERCRLVVPSFGVHPWCASKHVNMLDELLELIESSPMIGEIGLDYYFVPDSSKYRSQLEVFEFFLDAAKRWNKVINLHTKGAEKEVLELLGRYDIHRAIIHWYSGDLVILRDMVKRDLFFTIGFDIGLSSHTREIAQMIPMDRLLTETDNPGGPQWMLGEVRTPALVEEVVRALAEVKEVSFDEMADVIVDNFRSLIGNDPSLAYVIGLLADCT